MRAKPMISLLYEDANIALIDKPAGVLSHDDQSQNPDTVINRYLRLLYERGGYIPDAGESFTPALCNRLDRGTSGIVIAAKTRPALNEMNGIIKKRQIEKRYLAAVTGPPPKDGRYTAWLVKNSKNNTVFVSGTPVPGGREIITEFTVIARAGELSLLSVTLVTGRTHQIRAHLGRLGCPVLGDGKYGNGETNRRYGLKRQALAAYSVRFLPEVRQYDTLGYLAGQTFSLSLDNVWFAGAYFPGAPSQSHVISKSPR